MVWARRGREESMRPRRLIQRRVRRLNAGVRLLLAMALDSRLPRFVAAALLGAIWEPLLVKLFYLSGYIDVPIVRTLHALGLPHQANRPILAALWTILIGLLVGVPLGLFANRYVYWCCITFVVSTLLGSALFFWTRGATIPDFIASWSIPETWLFASAVPLFMLAASRLAYRGSAVAT